MKPYRELVWLVLFSLATGSQAAEPLPPKVRQSVQRACNYLKTTGLRRARNEASTSRRLGLTSLAILALYKAEAVQPTDPIVRNTLAAIRQDIHRPQLAREYSAPYSIAIALTALSEINPDGSAEEIRLLRSNIMRFQMAHGGFSCLFGQSRGPKQVGGDTSMTQYGALALWAMDQSGVGTSAGAWQNLATWLVRTQHSSGGYVYEPAQPARGPRVGTTAAALSALYICQARAKLGGRREQETGLPPALEKVEAGGGVHKMRSVSLPVAQLSQAAQRAEQWLEANFSFEKAEHEYVFYFLYSLERYHSFRELVDPEGSTSEQWYNLGLEYLLARQRGDGSWGKNDATVSPDPAPTAFAVLFLVRATRKMLQDVQPASGKLVGGRGLPRLGGPLELRGGQLRVKPLRGPADQLLGIIGDPNHPKYQQALAALEELGEDPDPQMLSRLDRQLRQLAQDGSPEAKIAAVKALAASGKMDVVPLLIRLLEDPDLRVMRAARDALRRLSRRMEGFGLPDRPSPKQRRQAILRWTRWYRTARPDAARELLPQGSP